jgi:hypothetical protein
MSRIDEVENEARMLRGELYNAFVPGLTAKRNRCHHAFVTPFVPFYSSWPHFMCRGTIKAPGQLVLNQAQLPPL